MEIDLKKTMCTAGYNERTAGGRQRWQKKTWLDGNEWTVTTYVPLGAIWLNLNCLCKISLQLFCGLDNILQFSFTK